MDSKNSVQSVKVQYPVSIRIRRSWFFRIALKPLLGLLVVLLLGLLIKVTIDWRKDLAANQCNGREDSLIYERAGSVMNPSAVEALGSVVHDMEGMSQFTADPTCLYVASVYYLNIGRFERAREYYDLLRDVSSKKQIIQVGPDQVKTIEQLDFEIT